jgi:hypothetical protein
MVLFVLRYSVPPYRNIWFMEENGKNRTPEKLSLPEK